MAVPPTRVSLEGMRLQARMLCAAGKRLLEERRLGPDSNEFFPGAAIVLHALACEIALKTLIALDRNIVDTKTLRALMPGNQGHDLEHLYGLLAPHRVRPILLHLKANFPDVQKFMLAHVEDEDELLRKIDELSRPKNFSEHLALSNNAFERWRYNYEHDSLLGHETFLMVFANTLAHEIGEKPLSE